MDEETTQPTDHRKIIDLLSVPFPPECIKQLRKTDTLTLDYIPHQDVTRRLNSVLGMRWRFELGDFQMVDNCVVIKGSMTVEFDDNIVYRAQYGSQPINPGMDMGDTIKAAGSDALKKCASLFGVGLHLYDGDKPASGTTTVAHEKKKQDGNPKIKNKYEKPCKYCEAAVPVGQGFAEQIGGEWITYHETCHDQATGAMEPLPDTTGDDDLPF